MAITKTGITVSTAGENDKTFEVDGQQSTVSASGLTPNKQYTVSAYVVDSGYGKINADHTSTFTTLPAGTATFTNESGVWGTSVKQLQFFVNWTTTYDTVGSSANFRMFTSTDNFSTYTQVTPSWQRNSPTTGSISHTLTTGIPNGGGNDLFVRVEVVDKYGEVFQSPIYKYTVPTQTGGSMSFTAAQTSPSDPYDYTFTTSVATGQFTYAPAWQHIMKSKDGGATYQSTGSWQLNYTIIPVTLMPNDWTTELMVKDIYGNEFWTSLDRQIKITTPRLIAHDTNRGGIEYLVWLNPEIHYDSVYFQYASITTGTTEIVDLSGNILEYQVGTVDVADGDYECVVVIEYSGNIEMSETITLQVENQGYTDIVQDKSLFEDGKLDFVAEFVSGFDLVSGELTVYKDDDNYEVLGTTELTIDGTTSGTLQANDVITGLPDTVLLYIDTTDDRGFTHHNEYWLPE